MEYSNTYYSLNEFIKYQETITIKYKIRATFCANYMLCVYDKNNNKSNGYIDVYMKRLFLSGLDLDSQFVDFQEIKYNITKFINFLCQQHYKINKEPIENLVETIQLQLQKIKDSPYYNNLIKNVPLGFQLNVTKNQLSGIDMYQYTSDTFSITLEFNQLYGYNYKINELIIFI